MKSHLYQSFAQDVPDANSSSLAHMSCYWQHVAIKTAGKQTMAQNKHMWDCGLDATQLASSESLLLYTRYAQQTLCWMRSKDGLICCTKQQLCIMLLCVTVNSMMAHCVVMRYSCASIHQHMQCISWHVRLTSRTPVLVQTNWHSSGTNCTSCHLGSR